MKGVHAPLFHYSIALLYVYVILLLQLWCINSCVQYAVGQRERVKVSAATTLPSGPAYRDPRGQRRSRKPLQQPSSGDDGMNNYYKIIVVLWTYILNTEQAMTATNIQGHIGNEPNDGHSCSESQKQWRPQTVTKTATTTTWDVKVSLGVNRHALSCYVCK